MEEKKEQEKQLEICPCCGKPTLDLEEVLLSTQVIEHYLSCVLTGEPFSREYYLYKGRMKIHVTSLSDLILDTMGILTSKFNFILGEQLKDAYQLFISRLFTLLPVLSISIRQDGEEKTKDVRAVVMPLLKEAGEHIKDIEWLTKAYNTLLDPTLVFRVPKNIINEVVAGHLKVEKLLETQSTAKNFFLGIVLA